MNYSTKSAPNKLSAQWCAQWGLARFFVFSLLAFPVIGLAFERDSDADGIPRVTYLSVNSGDMGIEAVSVLPKSRFSPTPSAAPASNTYWVRIELPLQRMTPAENWYLKIDFPNIDWVEAYLRPADGQDWIRYQVGDEVRFADWPVKYRIPMIPLGERPAPTLYAQVRTYGNFVLPLKVISEPDFLQEASRSDAYYAAVFSALIVMILSNLFVYLFLRDRSYVFYVAYIAAFSFVQLSVTGLGQQYLWPNDAEATTVIALMAIAMTNLFLPLFAIHYLSIGQAYPRISRLLTGLAWSSLVSLPLLVLDNYIYAQDFLHLLSLVNMTLVLYISIKRTVEGSRPAAFMTVSYAFLFFAIGLALAQQNSLIETSYWVQHLMEMAVVFEALLLSVGMAYRINLLRLDNVRLTYEKGEDQKRFYRELIAVEEKEKSRLGKLLHDGVSHDLLIIKNKLKTLNRSPGREALLEYLDDAANKVRDISHLFHPFHLQQLGFCLAAEELIHKTFRDSGIDYMVAIEKVALPQQLESELFYTLQECLNNIIKHSRASETLIRLYVDKDDGGESVVFYIKDDGRGFDTGRECEGFGLRMIRDSIESIRGQLHIDSGKNRGTAICIRIPS